MFRSRFLWKLFVGYMVLILVTALVIGVLAGRQADIQFERHIRDQLETTSVMLAEVARPHFKNGFDAAFQQRISDLGNDVGVRLTIIALDGTVLADSQFDPTTMDNHANRPEIQEALETAGVGIRSRFSATSQSRRMYLALPVRYRGRQMGTVRSSLEMVTINRLQGELQTIVFFTTVLVSLLALAVGLVFARRITQPLVDMTETVRGVASGDYGRRLPVTSHDEIGALARAFNAMGDELEQRLATIIADKNKLQAILTSMVEGVVAIDAGERILHLNQAAARMLDLRQAGDESQGRPIWELCRNHAVCECMRLAMRSGNEQREELDIVDRQKSRIIDLRATALRDANGGIVGAVTVLLDMTGIRQLERVRQDFIANVSHELKTPLTGIIGMIETMLGDRDMPEETRNRFLGRLANQAQRLDSLVRDLLTLSRLESPVVQERDRCNVGVLARRACTRLQSEAERKDIVLACAVEHDDVSILGDAEAMTQAIENLVGNAIRYTGRNGRVTVTVSADDRCARITVSDTGIGIAKKDQQRIFERFYRVDKARSREVGGTGLGLSIVKHVINSHQGTIEVDSEIGRGSTFIVELPL